MSGRLQRSVFECDLEKHPEQKHWQPTIQINVCVSVERIFFSKSWWPVMNGRHRLLILCEQTQEVALSAHRWCFYTGGALWLSENGQIHFLDVSMFQVAAVLFNWHLFLLWENASQAAWSFWLQCHNWPLEVLQEIVESPKYVLVFHWSRC